MGLLALEKPLEACSIAEQPPPIFSAVHSKFAGNCPRSLRNEVEVRENGFESVPQGCLSRGLRTVNGKSQYVLHPITGLETASIVGGSFAREENGRSQRTNKENGPLRRAGCRVQG